MKLHTTMLKSLLMGLGTHSDVDLILGEFMSIRFCFLLESDDKQKNEKHLVFCSDRFIQS